MKLDNRMNEIISHVDKCSVVADIGADHGYISAAIAERGLADKVIISDISEKSVAKARILITQENFQNVDIRVGDGTSVLADDECDILIIAGMGGSLIANILRDDGRVYNKYILSPQRDQEILRAYLCENSILPIMDYKVKSNGRYYDIIVAEAGEYNPSESELMYGNANGSDFISFCDYESTRLCDIINIATGDKKKNAENRLELIKNRVNSRK